MKAAKIGSPSIDELVEMVRAIQEKEKAQETLIDHIGRLVREDGFPVLDDFPYPTAAYRQDGTLTYVNHAFSQETGVYAADLISGSHNILGRITDDNLPLLDAVEQVFQEKETFLARLSDPLDIFVSEKAGRRSSSSQYQRALLFPIGTDTGHVSIGVVIFMERLHQKKEDRRNEVV
ncbi:hypothetical protein [Ethanoligenens sp.]|uniref:hypothetical protein n=1 Tax=Ethanoligenens sp. TaxID=2099655 RepID=UPI0039EC7469